MMKYRFLYSSLYEKDIKKTTTALYIYQIPFDSTIIDDDNNNK